MYFSFGPDLIVEGVCTFDPSRIRQVAVLPRQNMQMTTPLACLPSPTRSVSVEDFPPEVVHRVARHLSTTPRAKYWTYNVPAATVRALFLSSEPFPAAAAAIFDTVTTVNDPFAVDAPPASHGAVVSVACHADHGHLESIGSSLVSLNIQHACLEPSSPPSHFACAIAVAAHCASLLELSFNVGVEPVIFAEDFAHPALLNLLAARGAGLEAFTLSRSVVPIPIADAIARHCGTLRRLRVEVAAGDAHRLVPLLRGVGAGLRELALVAPAAWANLAVLKATSEVCASLARLEVRFMYGGVGAHYLVGKIVDNNGMNMRTLALSKAMASVPVLEGIAAIWPEVSFDVEMTGDAAPKVLAALDGRIVKLKLYSFNASAATQELDCSRHWCSNPRTNVRHPARRSCCARLPRRADCRRFAMHASHVEGEHRFMREPRRWLFWKRHVG